MKNIIKCTVVLGLITITIAVFLSLANNATGKIIGQMEQQKEENARAGVLGDIQYDNIIQNDDIWVYTLGEKTVAYTATGSGSGYGGEIKMIIGIDSEFKLIDSEIVSMSETPNLGTKTKDKSFLNQFIGKTSPVEEFDAISGATISSVAVKNIIEETVEKVKNEE